MEPASEKAPEYCSGPQSPHRQLPNHHMLKPIETMSVRKGFLQGNSLCGAAS